MNARWLAALSVAGMAQGVALAWPGVGAWQGMPVPVLQWTALCVLAWGVGVAPSARMAAGRAWVFSLAWLAASFWWLFVSMHTYGGLPALWAVAAVLALAGALALYYAAAGAVVWRWRGAPAWQQGTAWAAVWTLAEWARGTWLTGFPWGAVGYAQVDALAMLAPVVGVYGMGALSAGMAGWAVAWASGASPRGRWAGVPLLVAWGALQCWPSAGLWLAVQAPVWTHPVGQPLPVTLLQGNVPQDEKFQRDTGVAGAMDWYGRHIRAALVPADAPPSLVVAPETAIPLLPSEMDVDYLKDLLQAVERSQSALLLGLPLGDWDEGFTNSAVAWTPTLEGYRYHKHHLVPFGEFVPPLFRWFTQLLDMPQGSFRRGALVQPPLVWAGQRMAPNICYESVFGEELAAGFVDPAQAPTVLVNLSNLAWFGDSVAIDQHRHMSRLRALELQRPWLQATNTGATVVIDPLGRVTHALPRLRPGVLQATVQGREGSTPYAYWAGRWGLWPLVALCGLLLWWVRPRKMAHLPS